MNRTLISQVLVPIEIAERVGIASSLQGDHTLNPGTLPESVIPAAVLVLLVEDGERLSVVLTRRTDHLDHHPGEISLPGGRVEEGDGDPTATALRETEEEIGVGRDRITLLGALDPYTTRTGFEVMPVVGVVSSPMVVTPDPEEVAEVFEVPLEHLLDLSNYHRHALDYEGVRRYFFAVPYGDYFIWGATAGILKGFAERLTG